MAEIIRLASVLLRLLVKFWYGSLCPFKVWGYWLNYVRFYGRLRPWGSRKLGAQGVVGFGFDIVIDMQHEHRVLAQVRSVWPKYVATVAVRDRRQDARNCILGKRLIR